jgi:hypothetical protein
MKHKPRVGSLFAWITLYGSNQADPSLKWARKSNQPELQIIDMTVLFTNQAPLQSTCSTSRAYRLSAQHAVGAFFFFYVCSLFGLHRLKAELTITARRSMAFRGLLQLGPYHILREAWSSCKPSARILALQKQHIFLVKANIKAM